MTPDKVEAALGVFIEQMDILRDDFVRYQEGQKSVPFVVLRESLVAALNAYDECGLSVLTEALAAGVVSSEPAQYSNFKYLTNSPSSPELVEKQNAYAVLPMQILPAEFAGRRVRMIAEETP